MHAFLNLKLSSDSFRLLSVEEIQSCDSAWLKILRLSG